MLKKLALQKGEAQTSHKNNIKRSIFKLFGAFRLAKAMLAFPLWASRAYSKKNRPLRGASAQAAGATAQAAGALLNFGGGARENDLVQTLPGELFSYNIVGPFHFSCIFLGYP